MKNRHYLPVIASLSAFIPSLVQAQTPPSWTSRDIGSVGVVGSSTEGTDGGNFTVTGAGANLWDTSDSFRFVSQEMSGSDVQITARVAGVQNTSPYAKAGLMVRQGNATTSANAAILVTPGDGLYFQSRLTSGAQTTRPSTWAGSAPKWLKLTYSGGYAVGYISDNGLQWDRFSATRISLSTPFLVGIAVSSRTTAQSCEAVFENVQLTPASKAIFGEFSNAWSIENFGTVPTPGQGAYDAAAGTILVTGKGTGVGGTANAGAFLHRTWYGDGGFVVRVEDAALLATTGKAGLTLSQSTATGAIGVNLYLTGGNQTVLSARSIVNGAMTTIATATATAAPRWLKLQRTGDKFTASTSADGATWAVLGTTTVAIGTAYEAGLTAASGSATVASTAVFDGLSCSGVDGSENGLLDAWETAKFGNLMQSAGGNPDADGLTNAQE